MLISIIMQAQRPNELSMLNGEECVGIIPRELRAQ